MQEQQPLKLGDRVKVTADWSAFKDQEGVVDGFFLSTPQVVLDLFPDQIFMFGYKELELLEEKNEPNPGQ
jgi:hypothetical protein